MRTSPIRPALALTIALAIMPFATTAPAASASVARADATAPAALERVVTMRVDGSVEFDEQGRPLLANIDTKVPEPMVEPLRRQALAWKFQPVLVDGVPRRARTLFRLVLAATAEGSGYRIAVDSVRFVNPDGSEGSKRLESRTGIVTLKSMPPPAYPEDMLRVGASGIVVVAIRIGPDGKVMDAATVQSVLLDKTGSDRRVRDALAEFEQVAVRSARRARFDVQPRKPGQPMEPFTAMVPYQFLMKGVAEPKAGEWRTMVRTPKRAIAWEPQRALAELAGVADTDSGTSGLDEPGSAVRLASPIMGSRVL